MLMELDDASDNVDFHGEDDGYDADFHDGVDVDDIKGGGCRG